MPSAGSYAYLWPSKPTLPLPLSLGAESCRCVHLPSTTQAWIYITSLPTTSCCDQKALDTVPGHIAQVELE